MRSLGARARSPASEGAYAYRAVAVAIEVGAEVLYAGGAGDGEGA